MAHKIPAHLPKEQRIRIARHLLGERNVQVGTKQIKPNRLTGIGTWGVIDYLVNYHGFILIPATSEYDPL